MIDFVTIRRSGWWDKLKDIDYFNNLKINGLRNLEWLDEHEFMPEYLYYWEKHGEYYMKDQSITGG